LSSSRHFGVVTFKLADIGEGIAEVELLKNYKNVGDVVEEMEEVCEVQSDKAAVEITSRYSGKVIKLYHNVGEIVKIGAPLMDIEVEGAGDTKETPEKKAAPAAASGAKGKTASAAKASDEGHGDGEVLTSPVVRRLAKELGVDLSQVKGSGKGGRITKEDVEDFAMGIGAQAKTPTPAAAAPVQSAPATSAPLPPRPVVVGRNETISVPVKGYGRAMVKSMTDALKVPHMNIGEEVDMTELLEIRSSLKTLLEKSKQKLTITPFIIKALSCAMTKVPIMNSKFDIASNDKYTLYGAHNISIAIDTPNGLVVPSIKNVESLNVLEIQQELTRLVTLAESNKLSQADLTGGTVSLSNVGVIGGTYVKAILFDGQASIIALGRVMKQPRYDANGQIVPRSIMNVAISADHRHIDGATAARFASELKNYIENPGLFLLSLR